MGLKERWNRFANAQAGTEAYFSLTASHLSLNLVLLPLLEQQATGHILDLGTGYGAYRPRLEQLASQYLAIDVQPHNSCLDALADGRQLPFPTATFDTIVCAQVLEHTPEPWHLLAQAHRVLRPGGKLIISVPHLSYLHAMPEDYYRYTNYGLTFLLHQAGFQQVTVDPAGGVFALLGGVPQSLALACLPPVPNPLTELALRLNASLSHLLVKLDDVIDRAHLFALNFVAIAQKQV